MKMELNDNSLEAIIGGKIEHTWDNNTGSGTIWITARNPHVYTFKSYSITSWITKKQEEGWSDQEIMDQLIADHQVW